jgi:hypothetical protein
MYREEMMAFDLRMINVAALGVAIAVFAYRLLLPPQVAIRGPASAVEVAEPTPAAAMP